jgi:Sulfotransferase domain
MTSIPVNAKIDLAGDRAPHSYAALTLMSWLSKFLGRPPLPAVDVAGMNVAPERLAALRNDDQFLISYPRSGNTWVRHLLREVILFNRPDLPPPEALWMLIPDLHVHDMDHPARVRFRMPTRIFKSHNLRALRGRRMVYVFREPADALTSYYHFHLREKIEPELVAAGPEAFCRAFLPGWCEHLQLALDERAVAPGRVLLVAYEMLLNNGAPELGRIADFYGLPSNQAGLTAAIDKARFEKLREREMQNPQHPDEYFFRKGRSGTGREELSAEIQELIAATAQPLYSRARSIAEGANGGTDL